MRDGRINVMITVRTRIAPSPTGQDLHIGNAYTALINYVFAKKHKGQFIVRIEDTDKTRLVEGSEARILASLAWLGLTPDESPVNGGPYNPYRQSERLPLYKKYAQELIEKSHAYYCFCTPERLEQMRTEQQQKKLPPMYDGTCRQFKIQNPASPAGRSKFKIANGKPYVIRLKVPEKGVTTFHDLIRGAISFENKLIDDQIILKSDGYPTYHLGVVVDDHLMEISHIIRGEEWISSTPKHILLYTFLNWKIPNFAHMPLLRNPDKSKLSKRKNPVWISWYREEGYLPEALLNYLATLAWSYPGGKDIFSLSEMMSEFQLENIQTTAPIFDIEKLKWLNGEYIRKMEDEKLKTQIYEFFNKKYPEDMIEKILPLIKERIKTLKEFELLAGFFFAPPGSFETELNKSWLASLAHIYKDSVWNHEALLEQSRGLAQKLEVPFRKLAMDLRVAVTGKTVGPPLFESLELLGKEETLARLSKIPS